MGAGGGAARVLWGSRGFCADQGRSVMPAPAVPDLSIIEDRAGLSCMACRGGSSTGRAPVGGVQALGESLKGGFKHWESACRLGSSTGRLNVAPKSCHSPERHVIAAPHKSSVYALLAWQCRPSGRGEQQEPVTGRPTTCRGASEGVPTAGTGGTHQGLCCAMEGGTLHCPCCLHAVAPLCAACSPLRGSGGRLPFTSGCYRDAEAGVPSLY